MQRSADCAALGDDNARPSKKQRASTAASRSSDNVELSQHQPSAQALDPSTQYFVNPLLIRNCGNGFPQFSRAQVYIEVVWLSKSYTYRLNASILRNASAWFADVLKQPVRETNIIKAEKIKQDTGCYYKFELTSEDESMVWDLERVPFTLPKEWDPPYTTEQIGVSRGYRKSEHRTSKKAHPNIPYADGSNVPLIIAEAYDNMFRLMHGIDVKFDTENLNNALRQAEKLIQVTTYYGCKRLVCHASLGRHFTDFNRALFIDIMLDAPRWLKLSISLENESIFKEAMVHMVGKYRSSSWKTRPHQELPDFVWKLIERKYNRMVHFKKEADEKLMNNTATVYSRSGSCRDSSFRIWLISNVWHNWVENAINKTSHANPELKTYVEMYKLIDAGGDAYLPALSVYKDIKSHQQSGFRDWDLEEIERELDAMKTFAQTVVSDICINCSVLNVKEFNIDYMTCCRVDQSDIPWLQHGGYEAAARNYELTGALPC